MFCCVFCQEALCKSLLVADVAVFFVVGEVIGRRCWGGYKIPGAYGDTEMFTEEDIKKMDAERAKANWMLQLYYSDFKNTTQHTKMWCLLENID